MSFALGASIISAAIGAVHDIDFKIMRLSNKKREIGEQVYQLDRRQSYLNQRKFAYGWMGRVGEQTESPLQHFYKEMEKDIDRQLETLRMQRQSLETQKQDTQKTVAKHIESTFKNNYA